MLDLLLDRVVMPAVFLVLVATAIGIATGYVQIRLQ